MTTQLFELGTIIFIAAVLGGLAKILRQQLVLAYLITGIVIGYFGFFSLNEHTTLELFSDLGIMFLLFLVGLEINYRSLVSVGKASLVIGLGQIIFTSAIGYWLATLFGFSFLPALYIAVALTFSSTVIVVKLLSEKRDLDSLYGKISIGFLLVQDFVAILILIVLAGLGQGEGLRWWSVALTIGKGLILFGLMLWLGRRVMPLVFDRMARAQELLFLISLAWLFLLAAVVSKVGFSIEIAGFLAGLALANSAEHFQIANRLRPLRDFFIVVFFVILGSSMLISDFAGISWPVIVLSLFVLLGNPLIVLILMGLMGYRRRTSFLAGVTVAQISEFSLVLAMLGYRSGHIGGDVVSLITAVGIVTITLSTYLITHGDDIFKKMSDLLKIFEKKKTKENGDGKERIRKPIVLIGADRTGQSILDNLPPEDVLVIDFNPEVVGRLNARGLTYLFGDLTDQEIFDRANFEEAKLVISTSPDINDNLALLEQLRSLSSRPKVIVRSENETDAQYLYEAGADYVLLPHFTAGQYLGKTIAIDTEMKILGNLKIKDQKLLRKRRHTALED